MNTELSQALPMNLSITRPEEGVSDASGEVYPDDPLMNCLLAVARLYGVHCTRDALCAGLPINRLLTPSLFVRAADRFGLSCRLKKTALNQLQDSLMPVVILLKEDRACLLYKIDAERGVAHIGVEGMADSAIEQPLAELMADYAGVMILVRPRFQFEKRSASFSEIRSKHWFWQAIYRGWPLYRDAIIAAFLINVCALVIPLVTMNVYDRVVPNMAVETLWVLASGAVLALIFDLLLKATRAYMLDLASKRVDISLSTLIMERVLGIRLEGRPSSVGAFSANLRAFETVRDFIASASIVTLVDLPFVLLFILVLCWISPWFVLPTVIGGALMLLQAWAAQAKVQELADTTLRASAQRNAMLVESLSALETVKVLGAEGQQQARWERTTLFLAQVGGQLKMLTALTTHFAGFAQQLIYVATIVVGVYLMMSGVTSQGGIIAAAMLSARAVAPLAQLVGLMTQYGNAKSALGSVEHIMKLPVERTAQTVFFPRAAFQGALSFRHVTFSYPHPQTLADSGQPAAALMDVSFDIAPGERVAIIGAVGSGKSTIQKLLMGLYRPQTGSILIDGIDSQQIDPVQLRRGIGYLPQEVILFYGSLHQNLILGAPHVSEGQILAAAQMAGLASLVNRHPQGFEMLVGERGETLSGGQRTAIGMARAFLMQSPILLLDEPTAHMDTQLAGHIKQTLHQAQAGRTILIVSHQMDLLELVDRVIVLDRGCLVADGPKDAVLTALKEGVIARGGR